VYSVLPMKPDGIGAGDSPLGDFLRGRVERLLAGFQATGGPAASDRRTVERFLLALDELAAATDALAVAEPERAREPDRKPAPLLLAGEEPFASEIRRALEPDREVLAVRLGDAGIRAVLERRPALMVGFGARGAEVIRRIQEIRPGLPALVTAESAELPGLVEAFEADPVVILRAPDGRELALAIRALLLAGATASPVVAEPPAAAAPHLEPRSYAHLAGLLPRALERTVAFDVGAAVIARPGLDPLVDIFTRTETDEAIVASVRARSLALYRRVCGGAHAETGSEAAGADAAAFPLRSSMYFPLAMEGGVVGLTWLGAVRARAFSADDELVLASLAKNASGAYRRLEASVHRLRLSPRQSQVLALIASGLSDKEVASRLGLAHRTVRTHVDRMLREHGLRSRTEAVAAWLRGQQG